MRRATRLATAMAARARPTTVHPRAVRPSEPRRVPGAKVSADSLSDCTEKCTMTKTWGLRASGIRGRRESLVVHRVGDLEGEVGSTGLHPVLQG